MVTWLLWRRLRTLPHQQIPWWHQPEATKKPRRWLQLLIGLTLATGVMIWLIQTPIAFLAILWILLALPFGFLFLNGLLYGLYWAVQISTTLAREYELGHFSMLSLTPHGGIGASWLWATTIVNRNNTLHKLHIMVRAVVIIALLTLLLAFITVYISAQNSPSTRIASFGGLTSIVLLALVVVALFFEHMQSIVIGSLLGMLIPARLPTVFDARIWSVGVYLLLQLGFYALMVIAIGILPLLFRLIGFVGNWADLIHGLLLLLIFFALREGIIRLLWRNLNYQLNADVRIF